MSSAASFYEGFWMDHDQTGLSAARLTLRAPASTILIALIAIFVTACGSQMWSIIRFVLHQSRAGARPQSADDDEHLQLFIAHSSMSGAAGHGLALIWKLLRSPGPRNSNKFRWAVVLASVALFTFLGWTVAAAFSAAVALTDVPLLYVSPACGFYIDPPGEHSFAPAAGFQARLLNSSRIADEYVRTCYNTSLSANSLCQQFVQQDIRWIQKPNASCPFAPGMCLGGDNAAFEMDSGMIDSHETLGLNAARENRVLYRRSTTCAPVVTKPPYGELVPGPFPEEELALYHYGNVDKFNYTYQLSTYAQKGPAGYVLRYLVSCLLFDHPR